MNWKSVRRNYPKYSSEREKDKEYGREVKQLGGQSGKR